MTNGQQIDNMMGDSGISVLVDIALDPLFHFFNWERGKRVLELSGEESDERLQQRESIGIRVGGDSQEMVANRKKNNAPHEQTSWYEQKMQLILAPIRAELVFQKREILGLLGLVAQT